MVGGSSRVTEVQLTRQGVENPGISDKSLLIQVLELGSYLASVGPAAGAAANLLYVFKRTVS